MTETVAALEVGGTHVTGALVDVARRRIVPGTRRRDPLRADGTAEEIIGTIVGCGRRVPAPTSGRWGVAIPGPFDYARGIGRFSGVAKFEALFEVDLCCALLDGLADAADRITFLNDADAFVLGEWAAGAASGHERVAGITLGTGIGSAFADAGAFVDSGPSVPPEGRVDLLSIDGRPLEETVSRRAILGRYAALSANADPASDVHEVAERARAGEPAAQRVLDEALTALGDALAPWLQRFGAAILVVGGGMAGSWDLIAPPLRAGLRAADPDLTAAVVRGLLPDDAGLIGAALRGSAGGCGGNPVCRAESTTPDSKQSRSMKSLPHRQCRLASSAVLRNLPQLLTVGILGGCSLDRSLVDLSTNSAAE